MECLCVSSANSMIFEDKPRLESNEHCIKHASNPIILVFKNGYPILPTAA